MAEPYDPRNGSRGNSYERELELIQNRWIIWKTEIYRETRSFWREKGGENPRPASIFHVEKMMSRMRAVKEKVIGCSRTDHYFFTHFPQKGRHFSLLLNKKKGELKLELETTFLIYLLSINLKNWENGDFCPVFSET